MQNPTPSRWHARFALLPGGWARDVLLEVGEDGRFSGIETGAKPSGTRLDGAVLPGIANVHSHAFQFALAGQAEVAGPVGHDSFWTWRESMYGFLADLDPDDIERIATRLYTGLRARGYTAVGEFHYVHHAPGGTPYVDPAETSLRLLRAAETAGISITLLPVFYEDGGFGGQPAGNRQRRFLHDPDSYLKLIERLIPEVRGRDDRRLGIAPHSLRAVRPERLAAVIAGTDALDPCLRRHIHVAEQRQEVEDCMAWCGRRPVELLLDSVDVDSRWCLVHATHLSTSERERMAASGAIAGLCPTTEANLGDGLFPAEDYLADGGQIAIGSDSHVCLDPAEELRWLENGRRLATGGRTVLANGAGQGVGASLLHRVQTGGARALGRDGGTLAVGLDADFIHLLENDPVQNPVDDPATLLERWVFAPHGIHVADSIILGRHRAMEALQ